MQLKINHNIKMLQTTNIILIAYSLFALIGLIRSIEGVRVTDNFVILDINATVVSNVYNYSFAVSGLSTSSYTVGHYLIGTCNHNLYLPSSPSTYTMYYSDVDLVNTCGFSYSNSRLSGTVAISADICGIYNSSTVSCDILGVNSKFMYVDVTYILNLQSNATIGSVDITVKDINSTSTIDVVYDSIISLKGVAYTSPLTSLTVTGISTVCFRQTVFGVGNSLDLVTLNPANCENSFVLSATCAGGHTLVTSDLSSYPCSFSGSYAVSKTHNSDNTYVVEYCTKFDETTFASIPIVNDLRSCVGTYKSILKLNPVYGRRLEKVGTTQTDRKLSESAHIAISTTNITISVTNDASSESDYEKGLLITVIVIGVILIALIVGMVVKNHFFPPFHNVYLQIPRDQFENVRSNTGIQMRQMTDQEANTNI